MVMLNAWLAVCAGELESAACTVKLLVPTEVGVPEIFPVVESVSPGGRVPELKVQ
jgi:hypothetical protein